MSFYVVLDSTESLQYFPDNKPYNFKVNMKSPIVLENKWQMSLTELTIKSINHADYSIAIYSDICGESLIHGIYAPLLRKVYIDSRKNYIFSYPYYIPVVKSEFSEIEIWIKTDQNLPAYGLINNLSLVLHFKQIITDKGSLTLK